MKLAAGSRYRLTDENAFAELQSGKLEIYAVTRQENSFHQAYLFEIGSGGAAFPSMDEFDEIDIMLYAVEDSEFTQRPFADTPVNFLLPLMRAWFERLITLPWLRFLADRGDDALITWLNGSVLSDVGTDKDALLKEFTHNASIFAMLLSARFKSTDKKLAHRIKSGEKQKRLIVDETVRNLLGEDTLPTEDEVTTNVRLDEAAFIVRLALKKLSMPVRDVRISPDMIKNLDQVVILHRMAQKGSMSLRLITLEQGWHKNDCGVIIGYYGEKKELALLFLEGEKNYRLVTRSRPAGISVTQEIADQVDKSAFLCYAGLPVQQLSIRDLLKFMLRQTKERDWHTIILASVVAGLIPLITPIITETMFQDLIPILDREGLATVAQVAMVSGFTTAALTIVRSIALLRFSVYTDMSAEAAMVARILTLPTQFFRKFQSGDIAQRMMGMTQIQTLLSSEMSTTLLNFLFAFWNLFIMCWYSVELTIIAVLIWAVYTGLIAWLLRRMVLFRENMIFAQNKTSGILQQIFTGLPKFRMHGAESKAYRLWGNQFANEWKWNYSARWQRNHATILTAVQPILLSLALYYYVFDDISEAMLIGNTKGVITYASFLAFQAAYSAFNTSLAAAVPSLEEFCVLYPLFKNLKPILEAEPEITEEKIDADVLTGALAVRHLSFTYSEEIPNVLNDISFDIAAGEHVAIVGKSGCGKSTLIRLLLGFEKPRSGAVYYDGQDLSELSLSSVRTQLGVVLQGGQLMTGDIFRNIIGMSNLTLDDAWEAARAAGIEEDIKQMPMQMNTIISEGSSNISGGQRQRILIARALAMKPAIVIFDEATSALDNRTQAIVTESLNKLKATRIVVAHRLSTIRNADRIIVLDGGRIAETGTFDELVDKGGLFASFVKRQVI